MIPGSFLIATIEPFVVGHLLFLTSLRLVSGILSDLMPQLVPPPFSQQKLLYSRHYPYHIFPAILGNEDAGSDSYRHR